GGTINSVTEILDILLPKGEIVSATYKNGETKVLATSDSKEINLPMSVIINEQSASAAELFAQALKDYKKAEIVGVQS
ncbi:MAG: S41 family peptidase, partial [Oscillospiraceae bacterium]